MVQESLRQINLLLIALISLVLVGCATGPTLGTDTVDTVDEPVKLSSSSPANSLLQQAQQARQQGQYAAAGRLLERAISVSQSAESAVLYREFGELRLEEGQARNAEGMFMRALRDAPANRRWQAEIWQLIEQARQQQGDTKGAQAAQEKSQQLKRL